MGFQSVRRVSGTARCIQLAIAAALLYLLMPVIGAYAAASLLCPTKTATVVQGGSVAIDVSDCDGQDNFGMSDGSQPSHGVAVLSGQLDVAGTETVTYTHHGDSATSDSFYLVDQAGGQVTVNITITPAISASIAVSPANRNEDSGPAFTYTVTLSQTSSTSATTVNLTRSGTATSGTDYTGALTSIVVPANVSTITFNVTPVADGTVEADETVIMSVASGSGYSIGSPSSATATILNDDVPSASIAVSPASVSEDGVTNLVYTVTLDQAPTSAVSVGFSVGGGATSGVDYAAVSSPLVIGAGQTSGTITMNPTADGTVEADETVVLTLAAGSGYSVGSPSSATGTILNDDQPSLSINDVSLSEGDAGTTSATFTVSLSQPAGTGSVSFDIATADGTATAGVDYVASSLTGQTIAAGSSSATFTVQVNGDTLDEPNETFFVNVSNVSGASVADAQGQGTIVNDDAQPTLSIDDVSVNEGNSGTTTATFTVSLSAASGQTVSVNYASADGTAVAGSDYVAVSGTLTFAPGVTAQSVTVMVAGDTAVEPGETFSVGLSGASNATIARATGTGTVTNDDAVVTIGPASLPAATTGSAYSQTLTASGGTAPYSFAVTAGTLPAGLTLDSAGVLSGTPTAAGSFSFTTTATDSAGSPTSGSRAYSLSVSVAPVTVTPASLPSATVGSAYSQTLSASGGTAPYSFAVTAGTLPAGLTLDSAGVLSGTPTAGGSFSFTTTATDSAGSPTSGSRAYTLTVALAPASFVFTPAGGALTEAMVGEDYSQAISASGGSGSLLYSLDSGALPDGLTLNVSTGALTGPLDATAAVGDYSFTLRVTDGNSDTATAAYTLKVNARAVTVTDQTISVPAGDAPLNVDLTEGATGGPFITGDLVSVSPPNAGTVSIVNGEFAQVGPVGSLGWYLKFIPNPTYKGQVTVSFRLTSALGVSNVGVVVYNVAYDPGEVAEDIDTLVHGFVQTRQNLIATTVAVPGLLERRQMAEARSPITGRMTPGDTGLTTTFATSLTQLQAAKAHADGVEAGSSAFNAWMSGTFMLHDRDENGGNWGSFGMLSAGADYLLTEHALIGLSLHYDRMVDPTEEDAELTGNGWLAGPYGSFEVADGIYWDTSLLYGGSSNTIDASFWDGDFETSRYMLDTALKGELAFAEGKLSPKLRAVYFSEQVEDYSVDNADGDVMELKGFTTDQLRISVGADFSRQIKLDDGGILTPRLGATAGFSGLDGSGAFGTVTAGIAYSPTDTWDLDLGLLVGVEGDGQTSAGAKLGVTGKF